MFGWGTSGSKQSITRARGNGRVVSARNVILKKEIQVNGGAPCARLTQQLDKQLLPNMFPFF